jgi:GMP synthase-like glutamine amidotransferase
MGKKVYIENRSMDYVKMWQLFGYSPTSNYELADVIQFTGGYDVRPTLYGENPHPQTVSSRDRDEKCLEIYNYALKNSVPMAGICRGGQFLNVMNGGKMYQHCDGHAINGTHKAIIIDTGVIVDVTSTHHQIMRPNLDKGILLMESATQLSTFKEFMFNWDVFDHPDGPEVEAVYYDDTQSLCYQPHPEWCAHDSSCVSAYKYFLRNYLGLDLA